MKKNKNRLIKRANIRATKAEIKRLQKLNAQPKKEYVEPHPNAVLANEIKEQRKTNAEESWDRFLENIKKETKLGKEMLKDQEKRLKNRKKWQKRFGMAV